jgi:DNA-binding transcriptional LysR family regulator
VELKWLQDFLAVAETGNFTRAAAVRNTSQAAFSRRIQQLEAWLGVSLIDRSILPTRLTEAGENFKLTASKVLSDILETRAGIADAATGTPAGRVRLALPYALVTSSLPGWWSLWTRNRPLEAAITVGNVHDLGVGILSSTHDIMICFQADHQPILGDLDHLESVTIGSDTLRPFIARSLGGQFNLPPTSTRPLPLLMYSRGVFFERLVEMVIQRAGGIPQRRTVIENDMSDVLANMAAAGNGIAWLPQTTFDARLDDMLVPLGGDAWSVPLSIIAIRDRTNDKPSVSRLWQILKNMGADAGNAPVFQPYTPPNRSKNSRRHPA